jgi:hypothetical protein
VPDLEAERSTARALHCSLVMNAHASPVRVALALLTLSLGALLSGCGAPPDGSEEEATGTDQGALDAPGTLDTYLGCESEFVDQQLEKGTTNAFLHYTRSRDAVVFDELGVSLVNQFSRGGGSVYVSSSHRPGDGELVQFTELPSAWGVKPIKFSAPLGARITIRAHYFKVGQDHESTCTVTVR